MIYVKDVFTGQKHTLDNAVDLLIVAMGGCPKARYTKPKYYYQCVEYLVGWNFYLVEVTKDNRWHAAHEILEGLGLLVSRKFRETRRYFRTWSYGHTEVDYKYWSCRFVVRRDDGSEVDPRVLINAYYTRVGLKSPKSRPLWRRGAYGKYRKPQTYQVARKSFHVAEEGEPPVRCVRNANNLPQYWDDVYSWNCKNWKKQRKVRKQWMR